MPQIILVDHARVSRASLVRICAQNEPSLPRRVHLSQPTPDRQNRDRGRSREIALEIHRDNRDPFQRTQTCFPDQVDVRTARDRLHWIKWRQTVPCSAQELKQPPNSHSAHPPHTVCSQAYLRAIRELNDGMGKYSRPNFHPRSRL